MRDKARVGQAPPAGPPPTWSTAVGCGGPLRSPGKAGRREKARVGQAPDMDDQR